MNAQENGQRVSSILLLRTQKGRIHQIDAESQKTLCGVSLSFCSGTKFTDEASQITCNGCLRRIDTLTRDEASHQKWEQELTRQEEERQEKKRRWWRAYDAHLLTPTWLAKHTLVIKRDKGLCQGCRRHRAVQVHHLRYPKDCLPGSVEWITQEKLFDLVAVCEKCHRDIHQRRANEFLTAGEIFLIRESVA